MKVEILPRQMGKTTRMLEWMRSAPPGETRICVCVTGEEAMRLLRENPDLNSWQFMGFGEAREGAAIRGRGRNLVYGLDNLDMMLSYWFDWPVGMITLTETEA
jgi:hypothetical protein